MLPTERVRRPDTILSPTDAAQRLARRKTGDKPPSPVVRIRLQYVACRTERTELTPSRLFPSARRNCSREAERLRNMKFIGYG